jgi:hypothetical protein
MTSLFRYQYQDQFFENYWAVKQFEQQHNVFVSFSTNLDPYRKILADKKIDLDHNYDLDYLQLLRKTKSYIRLYYSGGSDSHHILTTAVENKIYIDEIVVVTRNLYNKEILQSCDIEIVEQVIPFLNTLSLDQVGKITFKNLDAECMRSLYQNPDWMFRLSGGDVGFRIHQFGLETSQNFKISDCQIIGAEKPSLIFYKDRWFATVIDTQILDKAVMNNSCLFYIMPENIKSYLVKAIKFKNKILNSDKTINSNFHFFPISTYYNYSTQPGKYQLNKFLNQKDQLALQEVVEQEDFDLLGKWHRSLEYLISVFPDLRDGNRYVRHPTGKFLWFIDLETFEIFSQQELIPDGFDL